MAEPLRTFLTREFGEVRIEKAKYSDGNLAILIWERRQPGDPEGPPIAKLSVNVIAGERPSSWLPRNVFYMKHWSENEEIAQAAWRSGWFRKRGDLPSVQCGHFQAQAWEVLDNKEEA